MAKKSAAKKNGTKKRASTKSAAKKVAAKNVTSRKPARKAAAKKPAQRATRPARPASAARPAERRRSDPQSLRVQKLAPSFTVNDLEASVHFYVDGLGFHVKERWESDGKLLGVMLVAGAAEIGLSQDDFAKGRDRKKGIGCRTWAKTTQPLEALAGRVRAAGIAAEIRTEPWGERTLSVTDPDGFVLTLHND